MIGRILGAVVGAAIAVTGYGMLKPALFAKYFDFTRLSLGPFAEYKTIVCWLIVAFGAVVVLASLQRPSGSGRKKRTGPVIFAPAEPEPAHAGPAHAAPVAEAHHDDSAPHDDHAHDAHDHGHAQEDHGHDEHHHEEAHAHAPAH